MLALLGLLLQTMMMVTHSLAAAVLVVAGMTIFSLR
jgi:hypothetical protein